MIKGERIEQESFQIIADQMKNKFRPDEHSIVSRVIHATGDFDFEEIIRIHQDAIEEALKAIIEGKDMFVDVKMVEAGLNKKLLSTFKVKIHCYISEEDVKNSAIEKGLTRAELSVLKAAKNPEIGIIAIGNAPTALLKTIELVEKRELSPKIIVGVPVGFVKAEESKEKLFGMNYPSITCLGKKGGSSVAVAIVNALLKIAERRMLQGT